MHSIVSNQQWKGWFSGMGSGGVILQNVVTAITPFIIGGLAIYLIYLIFKIGSELSRAEGPEQRKEAKIKLGGLGFAMILFVIGPTLILIFMNTIGRTVQTQAAPVTSSTDLAQIITLNIPKLVL